MLDIGGLLHEIQLTLYTDALAVTGSLETRQRRVTDILNHPEDPFLVLSAVRFVELGTAGTTVDADFAQVNLASVLFVVTHELVEPAPELRTPKHPEEALISIPPFKVIGRIHVLPERSLREALTELHGTFIPVTQATYWSDRLGEPPARAELVAVNHARAQILAPHPQPDGRDGATGAGAAAVAAAASDVPGDPAKGSPGW